MDRDSRILARTNGNAWIASRIRDSDVLHVGCTDWPLTEDRLKSGRLLHQELCYAVRRFVGIDLDAAGIAALRRAFPSGAFHVCLGGRYGLEISKIYSFQWHNPTLKNRIGNFISMPLVVFSRGRCANELAVEFRRRSDG